MKNPWFQIPASEYEAHMALPEVAQAQALSQLLSSALKEYTPASLAVIVCILSIKSCHAWILPL